jgi:CHAT domain-containing protein/tetratricopeptide (TPR) repeat protein
MKDENDSRVETLNQLGSAYIDAGRFADAVGPFTEALGLTGDQPSLWRSTILVNLGVARRFMGDLSGALECVKEALSGFPILKDRSHASERVRAGILNNLGALHRLSRNFSEAERCLKEALEVFTALPEDSSQKLSEARFSLALLYMDRNDYTSAKPYLDEALALTRARGTRNVTYAVQLNALATWDQQMGNLALAVRSHEEVTEIYKHIYGEAHPNYATNLSGLAQLYSAMGWQQKAETSLRCAASVLEASVGRTHPHYLETITALAVILRELGNYKEAEELVIFAMRTAEKAVGRQSPLYTASLHNLVILLPVLSQNVLIDLLVEFLELSEMGPTLKGTVDAFFELARTREKLELNLLEKIAAIEISIGMEDSLSYSTTLSSIGMAYWKEGNLENAEAYLRRAIDIERRYDRTELRKKLRLLALLFTQTGRPSEACALMQEANKSETHLMGQVFATGSEGRRMQYLDTLRQNYYAFLSLVANHLSREIFAIRAAFELVLQRKAVSAEAMAAQRDAILSGKYPHLAPKLKEWRNLRAQISRRTLGGFADEAETGWRMLGEWNTRKEALETELAREIAEIDLERQLGTAGWQDVARSLPRDATLIEFVYFGEYDFLTERWKDPRYLAFLISSGDSVEVELIDLGPAQRINDLIADFRREVTRAPAQPSGRTQQPLGLEPSCGQQLRELVLDPLIPKLDGKTRVFLATDGDLTRLPFECLPLEGARRAIDHYDFSYLNSGRDLLRFFRPRTDRPTEPVVVADPDFDFLDSTVSQELQGIEHLSRDFFASGLHFRRLEGTRVEGEAVARLLGVRPLLGKAALEQTVASKNSPLVLHIATHGFFLRDQPSRPGDFSIGPLPLSSGSVPRQVSDPGREAFENPLHRSGLALAGANRTLRREGGLPPGAEDGILTAEDVTGMNLGGTELVVLSACETGLGKVMAGEGVFGLQRAFTLAGAKTLIMSLWKVPDRQTEELMVDFYRRLLDGAPRAEALRRAQIALKEKYPHPVYWAAFICQGDPSPLENSWPKQECKA